MSHGFEKVVALNNWIRMDKRTVRKTSAHYICNGGDVTIANFIGRNLFWWCQPASPITNPRNLLFCHHRKSDLAWTDSQCSCLSMEETDAQSAATAVAGELGQHRPHRSAIDNRCFRRPACSTHSNLPGSRARRHRTSTWTGCTCAGACWCGTGTAPGQYSPGANGPLCAHYSEYFRLSVVDWH